MHDTQLTRGTEITVRALDDDAGVEIVDPIDRHRYRLQTSTDVAPTSASTGAFRYPVDVAVDVTTEAIALPSVVNVHVHGADGSVVTSTEHMADEHLPRGAYSIELSAPMKLYLQVDSAVSITSNVFRTELAFGDETTVTIGARSRHERPAATITTTEDPVDVMAAVSTFGSALKTTTAERSFPTLRGHPPAVELGDELDVPPGLEAPDTGVTIELPPDVGSVYVAAPLAYYLGATVTPGDRPCIRTGAGFEHALDSPLGLERETGRVLKQTFFLDCLTRTEGLYKVDLHERAAVEAEIDLDFAALYDRPIAEQLETYLDVPFDVLEPHLPEWKVTTHVSPTPSSIETLPFLVNDLATVRTPTSPEAAQSTAEARAVDEFFRRDDFTRSASAASESGATATPQTPIVQPETTDSLEQVWIGDETPQGASKATTAAFQHHLDRSPKDGDIAITVVCNDEEMVEEEEDVVDAAYGDRDELPFDVQVRRDLTTDDLAAVLAEERDFFHYIGHIEEDGFLCSDGLLDVRDLDSVGVDAFLLNACSSYEQGMALIERGSIGGVVTLSDVLNSGAVRIGSAMARLLNRGFPLSAAMTIARDESVVGGQYIVVGDGGFALTQAESGIPMLIHLDRTGDDEFDIEIETFSTSDRGLGSVFTPFLDHTEQQYLSSGKLDSFTLSTNEVEWFLNLEMLPIKVDHRLRWSNEFSPSAL